MQGRLKIVELLSDHSRWLIMGGLVAAVLVLQYATFRMGYNQGWLEGSSKPPQQVILQSDEKAMKTLAGFMADSASGPESLAQLIKNRSERLKWIHDNNLKKDVLWGLGRDLLIEGRVQEALEALHELMPDQLDAAEWPKWAPRAELTASLLLRDNKPVEAAVFFKRAAAWYNSQGELSQKLRSIVSACHALMADNQQEEALKLMDEAIRLSEGFNADQGRVTRARILSMCAKIERIRGNSSRSRQLYEEALKLWPEDSDPAQPAELAGAKICMGEALLEAGRIDEASRLFESGLKSLGKEVADLDFTLTGLRGMAQVCWKRAELDEALAYLYRAEGVAMGSVDPTNDFWSCLYDQLGWVYLAKKDASNAIEFFSRVVDDSTCPTAQIQSCEGLGRAKYDLGEGDQAVNYLKQSLELREKKFPGDLYSLGRVCKHLGAAYDLNGQTQEALQAYTKSLLYLQQSPGNHKGELLIETAMSKAYAHMEEKQWQEAVNSFQLALESADEAKRSECLENMARCYDEMNMRAKANECRKLMTNRS